MGTERFAMDLDGVIVDLIGTAIRRTGIAMPWDHPPGWDIKSWGLSHDQVVAVTRELYSPVTALEADPIDGALDAWRILERLGEIHVITAREDRYRQATYQWLSRNRLAPTSITFSSDKGTVAKTIGATLAFEDSPKHLFQYAVEDIAAFKPDYPYNRRAPGTPYASWRDLFSQEPLAGLLEAAIAAETAQEVAA